MTALEPDWPAPPNVRALTTLRGAAHNQEISRYFGPVRVVEMRQVHGVSVVDAGLQRDTAEADACFSRSPGAACRVVTADCLPMLICNRQGTEVAAVHAGWRGLAAGVLENALDCLHSPKRELLVWLGPAISLKHFEVGEEVRAAFLEGAPDGLKTRLEAGIEVRGDRYLADLYGIARARLEWAGITHIYGGQYCTFAEAERFCSWRRDREEGRMHSVIAFF